MSVCLCVMCAPIADENICTKKVELDKSYQDTGNHPSLEAGK